MRTSNLRDVIVIGAGVAGSSVSAALAAQGWDVLLIERDRFPRHKVCGEFLSPEAQGSLAVLGLHAAVAAQTPQALTQARLTTPSGATVQIDLPDTAWGLSRYTLDATLAQAAEARGVERWSGLSVRSVQLHGEHFQVYLQDEARQPVIARAVLAACGRHTGNGLPPRPRALPRDAQAVGVKAHYVGVTMPAQVELYLFPGGYAGVNAVEGGRVNVCLLASYAAFAQAGRQSAALLGAAATWNPALGERLAGATLLAPTIMAVAPVDPFRPAQPWDRVPCLGDTATMIPPLCGDGMAMALRSAELCAPLAHDFLQGTLTYDRWAARYTRQWHAEFDQRLRVGRLLQRLLDQPLAAEWLIRLGGRLPLLAGCLVKATRGKSERASANNLIEKPS
jgi:flavin-dependent dehydrogenase